MSIYNCLYGLLLTSLCARYSQSQECVYSPGELNTQVAKELGCVILDCKNLTTNYTDYDFDGWILPDVTYINSTYDNGKVVVNESEWTITVYNISREDTGLYHCMLILHGQYYLVRMGINVKGPFFISLWDEYQNNTVIGLVACGSFLVLSLLVWLLWRFRYQDDEDDQSYLGMKHGAINGFGAMAYPGDHKPAAGHSRVPSYIHTQQSLEELKTPGLTDTDVAFNQPEVSVYEEVRIVGTSEVRKRSPGAEKETEAANGIKTTWFIGGDNPSFVSDEPAKKRDSVVDDVMVDDFFSNDTRGVNVEVTEL